MKKSRAISDAVRILDRLAGKDQNLREMVAAERGNLAVARQIYELRTAAALSQQQLARKVGTTQSVISRLEDADYEGHLMAMLRRIAAALETRVRIRFRPLKKLHAA